MIKLKVENGITGHGLGYQTFAYVLMKTLSKRKGYELGCGEYELHNLKSTFSGVSFDHVTSPDGDETFKNKIEFWDDIQHEELVNLIEEDDTLISGYPTPINCYDPNLFEEVKKDLVFRQEIVDKCTEFKNKFSGQEIISLHIRRGDFTNISSGMFLCGDDYYANALAELPSDAKVFIFTNDKDYVKNNPLFQGDRFVLITDLYNGNELINCDWGQLIDNELDNSGASRFYWKFAIASLAEKHKISISDIVKELHPTYKAKFANNFYNHSFDMCLMTMCDYHILSNSTYGFWGAELSNSKKIIYPKYWMQGHDAVVYENSEIKIKRDLNGHDQTADLAGHLMDDKWFGMENPDPRYITIIE